MSDPFRPTEQGTSFHLRKAGSGTGNVALHTGGLKVLSDR